MANGGYHPDQRPFESRLVGNPKADKARQLVSRKHGVNVAKTDLIDLFALAHPSGERVRFLLLASLEGPEMPLVEDP